MDLIASWLGFPILALAVCGGIGLLVDWVKGGRPLPGALLAPVGLLGAAALSQPPLLSGTTAELAIPLVVIAALAGLWLGRVRLRALRPDAWGLAAAAGVFAVLGAPVILSGEATFAGYTILGDTSIHMIGADALLEHGRSFAGLPPSTYEFSLISYFGSSGYPTGGAVMAGIFATLTGIDTAWIFQPLLTLMVAFSALALWSLLEGVVVTRWVRALVVFVAAQPALVMAYALQGSIKEVGSVLGVTLLAALVPVYVTEPVRHWRSAVPLAVVTGGLIAFVGPAAALWIAPLTAAALLTVLLTRRWGNGRALAGEVAAFLVLTAVLCAPAIADLFDYVEIAGGVVTSQAEVGNLLQPLKAIQVFGIWITGDYRLPPPGHLGITYALIGVAIAGAVLGTAWLVRRAAWGVLLFLAVSLAAFWFITDRGSPWADGKALMIASPAVLLAAMLGVAALHSSRRTVEAVVLAGLIALGVLWSNALAYHDVSLAPRDRLAELDRVGERIDGQGPTLYTEFEEWGKHFLRDGAPEGTGEGWQRRFAIALGAGQPPLFGVPSDLDRFNGEYITYYRTIVLRRGAFGSRPPADYKRVMKGRFYDVWQRPAGPAPTPAERMPLGMGRTPTAVPDCKALRAFARRGVTLAYVERAPNVLFEPATAEHSPNWYVDPADAGVLRMTGRGAVKGGFELPTAGRYELWLEGSFGRRLDIRIDGKPAGSVAYGISGRQTAVRLGERDLPAGHHDVEITSEGGSPRPANGGNNRLLGPLLLTPPDPTSAPVKTIPADDYRQLCGRSLDWIEIAR